MYPLSVSSLYIKPESRRRPIIRSPIAPLALESRLVFDGDSSGPPEALVDPLAPPKVTDEAQEGMADHPIPAGMERSLLMPDLFRFEWPASAEPTRAALEQSCEDAQSLLRTLAERPDFLNLLQAAFGSAGVDPDEFASAAEGLRLSLLSGTFSVKVELRSFSEMQGYLAAYTAASPDGTERIYVNRDWIQLGINGELLTHALLQELGHAFDHRLNGGADSEGDEGARFADLISGQGFSGNQRDLILSADDHVTLWIDGRPVQAEHASVTFKTVYADNDSTAYTTSTNSIAIGTAIATDAFLFISADPSQTTFSGSDIAGQLVYTLGGDKQVINGIISRRATTSGTVDALYFVETTVLGGSVSTGNAYLLVLPGRESAVIASKRNDSVSTDSAGVATALNDFSANQTANVAPVITSDGSGASATIYVTEGATAVTTVTATDTGDTNTFAITGGSDSAKFTINSSTGVLVFNTAPDYESPTDLGADNTYNVQVTVVDSQGAKDVQDISVVVRDANDTAPAITSNGGGDTASVSLIAGSTAVTTVTATDADSGETLTYYLAGGADQDLFDLNASTGVLVFKTAAVNGTYDVTVGVHDAVGQVAGHTDTQALTVSVTTTDISPPTAVITPVPSPRNTSAGTVTITFNEAVTGVDIADFTLTREGVTVSLSGLTVLGSGSGYTIDLSSVSATAGTYVLTLKSSLTGIQDAANNELNSGTSITWVTDTTAPTLAITTVNSDISFGETEQVTFTFSEAPYGFTAADISVTGGLISNLQQRSSTVYTATLQSTNASTGPSVTVSDGSFTDQAGNSGTGATKSLTLVPPSIDLDNTAESDSGSSFTDNITTNRKPVLVGQVPTSNTTAVVTVRAGGVTYTYDVSVSSGSYSLNLSTATVRSGTTALPSAGLPEGTIFITVTAGTATASNSFVIDLTAPAAPTVTSQTTTNSRPTISGGVTLSDADSFSVSVAGADYTTANGLTIDFVAGTWSLPVPVALADGTYSVIATVTDAAGNSISDATSSELTIDSQVPLITGPSGAAGASTSAKSVAENTTAVATLTANETVTWSLVGGADQAAFDINNTTGALRFLTAPNYESPTDLGATAGNNTYVVVVQAQDSAGNVSTQEVTVTVTDVDERTHLPPTVAAVTASGTASDASIRVTLSAADADGTVTGYTVNSLPSRGTLYTDAELTRPAVTGVIFAGPTLYFRPEASWNGTVSFGYTATDNEGLTSSAAAAAIVIATADTAPVISVRGGWNLGDLVTTVQENQTTAATLMANEPVSWSIVGGPDAALFNLDASGALTFKAAPDYEVPQDQNGDNDYLVRVEACDAAGNTSVALVTVQVVNVNEPPRASVMPDVQAFLGDSLRNLTVPAFTDVDGQALTYAAVLSDGRPLPTWLAFDPRNRVFSGIPPGDFAAGPLGLRVIGSDGALTASLDFTLSLIAVPPARAYDGKAPQEPKGDRQDMFLPAFSNAPSFIRRLGELEEDEAVVKGPPKALALDDTVGMERARVVDPNENTPGNAGFKVVVSAAQSGLEVLNGIPDQFIPAGQPLSFSVPIDAFTHGSPDALIMLQAKQVDGTPLPDWMSMNGSTGTFSGTPTAEMRGEIIIKVIAVDQNGQQTETIFRLSVGGLAPQTRLNFSEQASRLAYLGVRSGTRFTAW